MQQLHSRPALTNFKLNLLQVVKDLLAARLGLETAANLQRDRFTGSISERAQRAGN